MRKLKKLIISFIDNVFGFFRLLLKKSSTPEIGEIKKKPLPKKRKSSPVVKKRKTIGVKK